jgi:hypothetical protein
MILFEAHPAIRFFFLGWDLFLINGIVIGYL